MVQVQKHKLQPVNYLGEIIFGRREMNDYLSFVYTTILLYLLISFCTTGTWSALNRQEGKASQLAWAALTKHQRLGGLQATSLCNRWMSNSSRG